MLAPSVVVGRKGSHGKVVWAEQGGYCIDTALFVDRRDTNGDLRYLFYLLQSLRLDEKSKDSAVPGLDRNDAHNKSVPSFNLPTQKAIADFLDRETARIDQLIEKKQRMAELLEEKRKSTIARLILGGSVARDDQSAPWLAWMPDHWRAMPLTQLVAFYGGATPSKDEPAFWEGDIPWISPKDMKREILRDSEDHISCEAVAKSSCRYIEPGAILIVTRGMILARTVPVALLDVHATINQDMKAMVPRAQIRPAFLLRLLQGLEAVLLSFVEDSAHGTKKLKTERLFKTPFPIPPLAEQEAVTTQIDTLSSRLVTAGFTIMQSIERLQELRSSLITAAVTGQIDINEWAKRESTERRIEALKEAAI
jgi:type I restriction enzyme S subunit